MNKKTKKSNSISRRKKIMITIRKKIWRSNKIPNKKNENGKVAEEGYKDINNNKIM